MKYFQIRYAFSIVIVIAIGMGLAVGVMRMRYYTQLSNCLTSARYISNSIHNYLEANNGCLFDIGQKRMAGASQFGWRVTSRAYIDQSPVADPGEIRSSHAGVFDLGGSNRYGTTIYAITGSRTAFGEEHRCRAKKLPGSSLVLISGRSSDDRWFEADEVEFSTLGGSHSIREAIGEAYHGLTIVVFLDGQVWAVNSSAPSELFLKCAEVVGEDEAEVRRVALEKFRIE